MKDYSKWMNPQTNQQQKQEVFQQYHYDAKYKVAYHDFIIKLSDSIHEYAPNVGIRDIEHTQIKHMLGGNYYLQGFTKQYGKQYRRYILDRDGKWHEVPSPDWVGLGYESNDDTLKAFAIDIYHEYWRIQNELRTTSANGNTDN